MRSNTLIAFLLLVLTSTAMDQPALATLQTDYASVDISPTYQELATGGTTTFTVGASSSSGGTVVVSVPSGLELLGSPVCSGGCRAPLTNVGAEETSMEFNIDGQIATLSFTVAVGRSIPAGTSLFITAYLVGGPQAIEQSSATIVVTETVPSQSPPLSDDNRMVFLDVSPYNLRIAPGGDALYRIWTGLWGMWSNQSPGIELSIHVPDGLTASAEPACGRGDRIPIQGLCESIERIEDGSGTTWAITPGYSPLDGAPNDIYVVLRADGDVVVGTSLQVNVSAIIDDDTLAEQPQGLSSSILVVSPESLLTPQSSPTTVGATLEAKEGYSASGASCYVAEPVSEIGLYEIGVEFRFSTATVGIGQLGTATDGSGTEVCLLPVVFSYIPHLDLYVLAAAGVDETPCRACVYGLITTTNDAEAVFPVEPGYAGMIGSQRLPNGDFHVTVQRRLR